MKRWILFTGIIALGVAAAVMSERRKVDAPASPAALLYLVADTEQELTRMPVNFTRMTDAEEIRIGDEIAKVYGEVPDKEKDANTRAIESYLSQIGGQLSARSHRKLPYRFHYIADPYMINAFALPGGHVYVGGGLLALMDSEDELAAVLGHEVEHIDHYHCAERAQVEQALRHIPLGGLAAIPIFVFQAGYSKDQELEADREGARLAVESGYSANGAIRMFQTFDQMYHRYRQQQSGVQSPQEELSQVAMETIEGYFRSHPLPAERIAQVQQLMAINAWPVHAERDLAVAYVFWTERARAAMKSGKYEEARQLELRSLKMQPMQPDAQDMLATVEFALADFAGSAGALRKMMEGSAANPTLTARYAMTLAAADRTKAAGEFNAWVDSLPGDKPRNTNVESAGLSLLAGDADRAHKLEAQLRQSDDPYAPDYLADLGWWYYLGADYTRAAQLLDDAVQQRPGAATIWLHRAWVEIELKRYSDAMQTVKNGGSEGGVNEIQLEGERAMAEAVAYWQAKEADEALRGFALAIEKDPEWSNANWVKALYSPLVVQSVAEMKAEQERRKRERLAQKH